MIKLSNFKRPNNKKTILMEIVHNKSSLHSSLKILFVLLIVNNPVLFGQTTSKEAMEADFEKFKNASKKEFQQYKDERDKEFADLLKKSWTIFDLENSKEPPPVPLPPKQPEKLPQAPKQNNDKKIPSIKPVSFVFPTEETVVKTIPSNQNDLLPLNKKVSFYNVEIAFNYQKEMMTHCIEINEKGVSDYWNTMSNSNYPALLEDVKNIGLRLQLNDWGYFDLIDKMAEELVSDKNDQTLFCFFMLSHLNFDVKVAKKNNNFILLVPFETIVYKKSFITIDKIKYYIIGDDSEGSIYTFKQRFSNANKPINLSLSKNIKLGNDYKSKNIYLKKIDKTIEVKYNTNLIHFFNQIPMSDLSVFFNSKLDPITENSLVKAITPLIENKNELEAVNIILDFVQNAFEYKTDIDQFGYEKFYFPEDIFHYPYSDCEDRSILFSHLIKTILKLDVIGLEYNTHAACAVKFSSEINGDSITFNGAKYIICDPTYIGASAGMSMPQFANEKPEVIKTTYN